MDNDLIILNGRTLGDLSGSFTCIRPTGCSVVDYFAVTHKIMSNINFLEAHAFTPFSDHRPITLTLKTNCSYSLKKFRKLNEIYDSAPCRFIFNDTNLKLFTDIQQTDEIKVQMKEIREQISSLLTDFRDRNDIVNVNSAYIKYIHTIAQSCFKMTNNKPKEQNKHSKPWFNAKCKSAKRELGRAARATSNHCESDFLRTNFYQVKKFYNTLINRHKNAFFSKINKDIEDGKLLNWQQFKKLKNYKNDILKFDSLDMENFEEFFKSLYAAEHSSLDHDTKETHLNTANTINDNNSAATIHAENILNSPITFNEISNTIKTLKSGKASSDDLIANEILKGLDHENIITLLHLLNLCLDKGVYPWNTNIITLLLKKGGKDDPDNYRAIAVSSAIGKLFSTILLDRFVKFRQINCPDAPNQLGFTKGAQTYDHILTIQTICSKYKKLRKPVYAVFVDFKKAFDSVCRQALLLKLAKSNMTGKFFNVIRDMYSNSVGQIKLSGHLSNPFEIKKGTEQGHPLSPDFFKLYISDMTPIFEFDNCPKLADMLISHLLWADDLIILSLDKETTQNQLNNLHDFCLKWGLEVNIEKTNAMILGHQPKGTTGPNFKIGNFKVKIVDDYCYLGIVINKTGSLKLAQSTLKDKAMRAFFGLKRTVDRSKISFRAKTTLFDSLIKPIVLYGAPVWLPTSPIIKHVTSSIKNNHVNLVNSNILNNIRNFYPEKVHLSFLRWALNVHKKSSTIGIWGETGRYPLIYQTINLTLNYYKRIESLKPGTIVYAALLEQKRLKLNWYKNIELLLKIDEIYDKDHVTAYNCLYANRKDSIKVHNYKDNETRLDTLKRFSHLRKTIPIPSKKFRVESILKILKERFRSEWAREKKTSTKLSVFYDKIKHSFVKENYLDLVTNAKSRYATTRLRISAHDLEIEQGRYKKSSEKNAYANGVK